MNKISNQKGIALISLTIAVTIILIITGTVIYNIKDNLKIEKLEQMQSDIENLRDKIDTYYAQYGAIPVKKDVEYTNIEQLQTANIISSAVDTGKFYVIDLQSIENLTLHFGQDYENVKNLTDATEVNSYTNLYIINEASHNIFFVKGIEIDGELFYTNYRVEDVDTEPVVLINIEEIENNWSPVYDTNGVYKDKNEDTAIIPAEFKVSKTPGMDTINGGLVIQDEQGNEFVWIPVTSEDEYVRNTSYGDETVSAAAYTDKDYLPDGIQPTIEAGKTDEEIGLINESAERDAVVSAGGFYIGRYEAGDAAATTERTAETDGELVIQKDKHVYGYISQINAKIESKGFINNDNVKSALCSGIQWDMVMAFVDGKNDSKGNIYNVSLEDNNRHMGTKLTGFNKYDEVQNICDLEGNCYEWVAEKNTTNNPFVVRAGTGVTKNNEMCASRRHGSSSGNSVYSYRTFRVVLYVM